MSAKTLIIDIETAPIQAYVWQQGLYNTNIRMEQIISDTFILSFAAKWLDEEKVIYEDQSGRKTMSNDTPLLKSMWKLLDQADIVVVQNGVAFDIPSIKARMMSAGLPPPSPFRTIDTYRIAKNNFNFTYNKLAHLADVMGCPIKKDDHREYPGIELWKACLARDQKAWKVMKKYNIQDVQALEGVYLRMRPWIENHPNVGAYTDDGKRVCPKCSGEVMKRGVRYTNAGFYQRYHCQKCGGYSRGKTLLNSAEHRRRQLV